MPTPSEQLLSRTIYDVDGTTTVWNFSFTGGYLDPSHVKAYTELPTGVRTPIVVTPEMLIGEFQLQITPALAAGSILVIYRDTPKNLPLVDFVSGPLSETALDTNAKQAVFIAAEAIDIVNATDVSAAIGAAEDAAASAAVALAQADIATTRAVTATTQADIATAGGNAAAARATAALDSQNAAGASATAALDSQNAAAASAVTAQNAATTAANDAVAAIPVSPFMRTVLDDADAAAARATLGLADSGPYAGLRNKIINGKMEIAQRGTSFAAIADGSYSLDRWLWGNTSAGVVTVSQQADVPGNNEFQSSLRVEITTADSSVGAADEAQLQQVVEGYSIRDLIGRTFTLGFWVRSSKTGIHTVCFFNSGADRRYIAEYTVSAANTWEFKTIPVTGGLITAGTWNYTNGAGLAIRWNLMTGTNGHGTAGSWVTTGTTTANQVNCLDTVGNIFAITGVQLEPGTVVTPFEARPVGLELMLCQRYYQSGGFINSAGSQTGTAYFVTYPLRVAMRATPTVTITAAPELYANSALLTVSNSAQDNSNAVDLGFVFTTTSQPTNSVRILGGSFNASAEL